ncbi:Late embryogenesis abundant (LEA) hydroxyproline-rich glycoprotein family [Striga hermonthica]|uniref:Late embryogenesis abundant (LEA) hydroxyproline-rich glycoprotein family n=1 Tax=Striga hermonthica TaxID=68872 RepID=A0A9N7N0V4_STRHE|nr:Late embryogenesis abundant (LEA) hydroxyproline-rich glycoprotein family [Striga hermonthica]
MSKSWQITLIISDLHQGEPHQSPHETPLCHSRFPDAGAPVGMSNPDDPNRPVTGYPAPQNAQPNGYPPRPPPGAAVYPYAAPPPPSNPYYNYPNNPYHPQGYQYDPESARRATCLRRIFAFLIGLVVIFGAVTFIVWLVLRPQLPEFRVDAFSISNFTLGNDSRISFTSEIRLTARNPNKKMTLAYEHIEAVIFYRSESLSETVVPPFWQDTKNETSLTANFAAAGSFVSRTVADEINGDRLGSGNVDFNLRMLSRVRFEAKAWSTQRRFLKVFCGDLIVGVPSNGRAGALIGGPQQCRVGI